VVFIDPHQDFASNVPKLISRIKGVNYNFDNTGSGIAHLKNQYEFVGRRER